MSTTKFMTATGSNRELHIKRSNEDHVQIRQFDPEFHTHQAKTFFLNPSEAPALCLAILEAAGWPEQEVSSVTHTILSDLNRVVEFQERATAEAEARALLEAEALELCNAHRKACGSPTATAWDDLTLGAKENWLAVARRAREMRAEK